MDNNQKKLHAFLFPLMFQGHMIPMIDIARMLASRGLVVTIITTPLNSSRFKTTVDRAQDSGYQIRLIHLRFPRSETGLPEDSENMETLSSHKLIPNLLGALPMLQNPFEELIKEHNPDFIISDSFLPWTLESATKFHIPRLVFHGTSCFAMCCSHSMAHYKENTTNSEIIVIPDLPDKIAMKRANIPNFSIGKALMGDLLGKAREADCKSFGVVLNSFYELEPAYVNYYQTAIGIKAWPIGPVSLSNKEIVDKADRGNRASIEQSRCLNWLDSKKPGSVLYVCFGTWTCFPSSQLVEIAVSLENCNRPFIWVIGSSVENEEWLPEGYEERIEGRGLVIRGWAPQILILSHHSMGGFMTHCGWNSTLEGVSAGLPFVTWPITAEQFYNEKVIVQVLKTGVGVGSEAMSFGEDQKGVELVKREKVEEAVDIVMGVGEGAEGMRKRAREYGEMARRAMEEGGSSYMNMSLLIEDVVKYREGGVA